MAIFPDGHTFRTSLNPMRGTHILPVIGEMRAVTGLSEGPHVEVRIGEDVVERTVELADASAAALATAGVREAFDRMAYLHRNEWMRARADTKSGTR